MTTTADAPGRRSTTEGGFEMPKDDDNIEIVVDEGEPTKHSEAEKA